MKIPNPMRVSMVEAMKNFEMKVTVKPTRIWRLRLRIKIGLWLMKLASFIINCKYVVIEEGK